MVTAMFPRLPRLLWRGLLPGARALCAVEARAWVWGLGVRHLQLYLLVRLGLWARISDRCGFTV